MADEWGGSERLPRNIRFFLRKDTELGHFWQAEIEHPELAGSRLLVKFYETGMHAFQPHKFALGVTILQAGKPVNEVFLGFGGKSGVRGLEIPNNKEPIPVGKERMGSLLGFMSEVLGRSEFSQPGREGNEKIKLLMLDAIKRHIG
ncbi:MAG: hypothetical protein ABIG96_01150 [Candidatus Micrarchaeota archaeon]